MSGLQAWYVDVYQVPLLMPLMGYLFSIVSLKSHIHCLWSEQGVLKYETVGIQCKANLITILDFSIGWL